MICYQVLQENYSLQKLIQNLDIAVPNIYWIMTTRINIFVIYLTPILGLPWRDHWSIAIPSTTMSVSTLIPLIYISKLMSGTRSCTYWKSKPLNLLLLLQNYGKVWFLSNYMLQFHRGRIFTLLGFFCWFYCFSLSTPLGEFILVI